MRGGNFRRAFFFLPGFIYLNSSPVRSASGAASRANQESWRRLELRECAGIPYTKSSSAEVGDFVADMEVHGKPSLETGRVDFLLIFCRRLRDGRGRWSSRGHSSDDGHEVRTGCDDYASSQEERHQRVRRSD